MTDVILTDPQPETASQAHKEGRPARPWTVEVDVYLEDEGPPAQFHLDSSLPKGPNGDLIFQNNHRPGFNIEFHLIDLTGKGYLFPKPADLKDSIWCERGTASCPTSAVDDILTPRNVSPDRKTLTAYTEKPDENHGGPIGPFRFTLNVTKTGEPPFLPLDPGGDDQDGARTFSK